jgi:hypothetical protein
MFNISFPSVPHLHDPESTEVQNEENTTVLNSRRETSSPIECFLSTAEVDQDQKEI